jgi:hypothetical protein
MSLMRTLERVGAEVGSVGRLSMNRIGSTTVRKTGKAARTISGAVIAFVLLAPIGASAQEVQVSANAGWVSQYFYRGILRKTSSASAGLDVSVGPVSLGTWAAGHGETGRRSTSTGAWAPKWASGV